MINVPKRIWMPEKNVQKRTKTYKNGLFALPLSKSLISVDGKKRTKTDKNGPKRTKTDQSVIFALWLSRKLLEIKMAANYKAAYTVDNKMATLFPKNQIKFNIMGG